MMDQHSFVAGIILGGALSTVSLLVCQWLGRYFARRWYREYADEWSVDPVAALEKRQRQGNP